MELYFNNSLIVPFFPQNDDGEAAKPLLCLADKLASEYSVSVRFCFPEDVREREWVSDFNRYGVCFIPRQCSEAQKRLKKIFADLHPNIVHTFYGGYDVPAAKASRGGV